MAEKDFETDISYQKEENIKEFGSTVTEGGGAKIFCLTLIGQIEGHYLLPEGQKASKYEHIIPALVSVEQSEEIEGLLVILNTAGGDVEAGLAIAEMIGSMKKPSVSLVLGGGHSIGVPLAVAAKRSFIVPTASMTLHPVRTNGLVIGVPQTFYYFNRMQERILRFIADNSSADIDVLRGLMMKTDEIATDVGSILDGKEAVKIGLIDEIGGLSRAVESLKTMIKEGKEGCKSR
jgi:ATP-dependent protease ClpP protease subunit